MGSFVGAYSDLWTVEINRQAKTGVLRGGDIGWDTEIRIKKNRIRGGVILDDEEFGWLEACWRAATGGTLERPANLKAMRLMRAIAKGDEVSSSDR